MPAYCEPSAVNAGAGDRNRTRDLLITNELLYRLSYTGTPERAKAITARQQLASSTGRAPGQSRYLLMSHCSPVTLTPTPLPQAGYGVHTSRLRGKHREQAHSYRILQAFVPNLQNSSVGASLLAMLFAAGFCWAPPPVEVWRKSVGASAARELGGYDGKLAYFCYKLAGNRCAIGRPTIHAPAPRCVQAQVGLAQRNPTRQQRCCLSRRDVCIR